MRMMMRSELIGRFIAAAAAAVSCAAMAMTPQQAADQFAADPSLEHASVGICILDMSTGEVVAAVNPDQSEVAASTIKTITAATALYRLGPDFTFSTQVIAVGGISGDGTLCGDLVIKGGGDPTLGSKHFDDHPSFFGEIISALQDIGVKRIEGAIVPDGSAIPFPPVPQSWTVEDLGWGYGAGCFGLCYADNLVTLSFDINGSKPSRLKVQPEFPSLKINNLVTLHGPKEAPAGGVSAYVDYLTPGIILWGSAERSEKRYGSEFANPAPQLLLRDRLSASLAAAGIQVGDEAVYGPGRKTAAGSDSLLLLDFSSPPLSQILASMLERSDNMYAEMTLRAVAAASGQEATPQQGVKVVERFWKSRGLDTGSLFMKDGSGLSRAGKASARFLCQVLAKACADSLQIGASLPALLPRAGQSGTVKSLLRKSALKGKLALKSGSMNAVHCYVGYYPAEEPRYTVAILVNNFTGYRSKLRSNIEKFFIRAFAPEEK